MIFAPWGKTLRLSYVVFILLTIAGAMTSPAQAQLLDDDRRLMLPPLSSQPAQNQSVPQQVPQHTPSRQPQLAPQAQGIIVKPTGGDILLTPPPSSAEPVTGMSTSVPRPFGADLFMGGTAVARALGVNPDYIIATGDKIAVQIWGGDTPYSDVLTVDIQGNVFIPNAGPVRVAGMTNARGRAAIEAKIAEVFTSQVRAYTTLLNTQPVGVYVTGAVVRPGRYAGERTDSLLYYIAQAGGIEAQRGSYRDIRIIRNGEEIGRIDLYRFLLEGHLIRTDFQDNDTIVVQPQNATFVAEGDVRNAFRFEFTGGGPAPRVFGDIRLSPPSGLSEPQATQTVPASQVIAWAQPLPRVSHVAVQGLRNGQSYSSYMSLAEFRAATIYNGDTVRFLSDVVSDTIFVNVVGQHMGASSFVVPRGTSMAQLLDAIAVSPTTAETSAIYIRRKSVADRQRQALQTSLGQLQRVALTTRSSSPSEAEIRVREAELVERFIRSAQAVEPEGRVVLDGGQLANLQLEPDDTVVIPQRSNVVMVSGEVTLPQTLVYQPNAGADYYINGSGGFTERADEARLLVVRQNGSVSTGASPDIRPGDQIMVLPEADTKKFAIFKDIVDIVYRIAVSSGVVLRVVFDD